MSGGPGMTEPGSTPAGRYEIEFRRPERSGGGWRWQSVMTFDADHLTTPLRFETLDRAVAYAGRAFPGAARVVAVDREGGREVVG